MKVTGRKTSSAYEIYGFIPNVENGKHSATCKSCNRVLQNTAAVRLQKHRNSCFATRSINADPANYNQIKKGIIPMTIVAVNQNQSIVSNVKREFTEQSDMEFTDVNTNCVNDNKTYEDTLDAENLPRSEQRDQVNVNSVPNKEHYNSLNQEETSFKPPDPIQQLSPFEYYHTSPITTKTSPFDVDVNIQEESDDDIVNMGEELQVIQNLMPRSKESKQLQYELSKIEAEYYRCKAAYFMKLTENCKIKRTLMLLESRKLQLEIEQLVNES